MLRLHHKEEEGNYNNRHSALVKSVYTSVKMTMRLSFDKNRAKFFVRFPSFFRLKQADSVCVYHNPLASEPEFSLQHHRFLNFRCPS